ncbi:MAG: hypothetical protein K0Q70_200 [Rhodospirillales bacterium]|jgi:hypothetical protein|nr:hypothetical protein [Rhodospirillales bacterium]
MLNHPLTKSHYRDIVEACSDDTASRELHFTWQGVKMLTTTRANLVENPTPLVFLGGFAYDGFALAPARQTIPGIGTALTCRDKGPAGRRACNSDLE